MSMRRARTERSRSPHSRILLRDLFLLATLAVLSLGTRPAVSQPADLPVIERVSPEDVLPDEPILVQVYGNFGPATRVRVDGVGDLIDQVVKVVAAPGRSGIIAGYAPPLGPGAEPGWRALTATDARGSYTYDFVILYVPADNLYLKSSFPTELPTTAGTPVYFYGRNFVPGLVPVIANQPCTNPVFLGPNEIVATAPALDPNPVDSLWWAEFREGGPDGPTVAYRGDLYRVVAGTKPPRPTSLEPARVDAAGGTPVTIRGENFRADTVITFGHAVTRGRPDPGDFQLPENLALVDPVFVSSTVITGKAPSLDARSPALARGFYDVAASDARGRRLLTQGVQFADPIEFERVIPDVLSSAGGERVTFEGTNFAAGFRMEIGGVELLGVVRVDSSHLEGTTPPLSPGVKDARILDANRGEVATLLGAVEVIEVPAVVLASVRPPVISSAGGEELEFVGQGFRAGLRPRLGGVPLSDVDIVDATLIRGVAPALAAGFYDTDIEDDDGTIVATLFHAVEVIDEDEPIALGPAEVEATLAEGTARFTWFNPIAYDKILVKDVTGRVLRTLNGSARTVEIPVGNMDEVKVRFEATPSFLLQIAITDAVARRPNCTFPTPLQGTGVIAHKKYDFTLYGGNRPREIPRCQPGADGGGLGLFGDVANIIAEARSGYARNGAVQPAGSIGSVVSNRFISDVFHLFQKPLTNRLITGFQLPHDADRLFIRAHYQKLEEAFGLKLKARLIHMFPEDGFVDEFTFPDVAASDSKDWNGITYFRADRDVIEVTDSAEQSCGLPIPAGDYVLELFAEGADANTPYFVVTSDNRAYELQIPGTPCPPYPLVEVQDVTGFRTLPDLTGVTGLEASGPPGPYAYAQLTAHGSWFDEAGRRHSIVPGEEGYIPDPGFEYTWRIYDVEGGTDHAATRDNPFTTWVQRIGCYRIDLTVRDTSCNRSIRRSYETAVFPRALPPCDGRTQFFSAVSPVPDVSNVFAVAGLRDASGNVVGNGEMATNRSLAIRLLVIPPGCCAGSVVCKEHPAAKEGDLEFRLLAEALPGGAPTVIWGPAPLRDLCDNIVAGSKYFLVFVSDLGRVALIPGADGRFRNVSVQFRTKTMRTAQNPGGFPVSEAQDPWRSIGPPIHMTNRPHSLEETYWRGYYTQDDQSYHFITRATAESVSSLGIPPTKPVHIPLPKLPALDIPKFENSIATGLATELKLVGGGDWDVGTLRSSTSGELLGNVIDGRQLEDAGKKVLGRLVEETTYDWSHCETILEHSFEQELFRAIIFSGTIGPIPVTVWATVGLGIQIALHANASAKLSPFAPLIGQHFFEGDLGFDSSLKVSLPASIRADFLFGVVSYIVSFIPSGTAEFLAHVGAKDDDLEAEYQFRILLNLAVEMKLCALYFLCVGKTFPILKNQALVDVRDTTNDRMLEPAACSENAIERGIEPDGIAFGTGGRDTTRIYFETFHPVAATSPDGKTALDVSFELDGRAVVRRTEAGAGPQIVARPTGTPFSPPLLDPAITFVTNDLAMIAWTASYPEDSGVAPLPSPGDNVPLDVLNRLKAQDDINVTFVSRPSNGNFSLGPDIRISDPPNEVPNVDDRRVDGRAAIAGDVKNGEALVAWVRFESPDFIIEENVPTTIAVPLPGDAQGYQEVSAIWRRPQLEKTAIYTRFVSAAGTVLGLPVKISPDGINIEPGVAFSPTGNVAYCVWVHDPEHIDLVRSNRGRTLLYSVWSAATDSWSAPRSVLEVPDDFPGVLEPSISLRGDGEGILGFTALPKDAAPADTGYSNRYIHISRLIAGEFTTPQLLRNACKEPVLGHWLTFSVPQTGRRLKDIIYGNRNPDWVMTHQQDGLPGTIESAGGIAISVLGAGMSQPTPPVVITSSASRYSNIAATVLGGGIHAVGLNGGPSVRLLSAQGGALGLDPEPFFETVSAELDPDLAIARCDLSDSFAAPGAFVDVTIDIENRGFGGSTETLAGESATALEVVYVSAEGTETPVTVEDLPILQPGGRTTVELEIEMPHEPVVFLARLNPNPIDRDRTNDQARCFFGAPPPENFHCEEIFLRVEDGTVSAAKLSWTAPAGYDEILIYRDGSQFKCLPGACTTFVDHFVEPGEYLYEIRGRIGSSRSTRVEELCTIRGELPAETFRRGDQDGNGRVDISDAIAILNFLFLGGSDPACYDAADADDSGGVSITDPIRILNYLFIGGADPAAPGPRQCGEDPTPDALPSCGDRACRS